MDFDALLSNTSTIERSTKTSLLGHSLSVGTKSTKLFSFRERPNLTLGALVHRAKLELHRDNDYHCDIHSIQHEFILFSYFQGI